jgi:hypothetical protein
MRIDDRKKKLYEEGCRENKTSKFYSVLCICESCILKDRTGDDDDLISFH